jgi:hypothetical protein
MRWKSLDDATSPRGCDVSLQGFLIDHGVSPKPNTISQANKSRRSNDTLLTISEILRISGLAYKRKFFIVKRLENRGEATCFTKGTLDVNLIS